MIREAAIDVAIIKFELKRGIDINNFKKNENRLNLKPYKHLNYYYNHVISFRWCLTSACLFFFSKQNNDNFERLFRNNENDVYIFNKSITALSSRLR